MVILSGSDSVIYCHCTSPLQHGDIALLRDWLCAQHGMVIVCGVYAAALYVALLRYKPLRCKLSYCNHVVIPKGQDWQLIFYGVSDASLKP